MQSQLAGAVTKQSLNDIITIIGRMNDLHSRLRNRVDRLIPCQPRAVPTDKQKEVLHSETMDAQLARVADAIRLLTDEMTKTAEDLDRAV